MWSQSKGEEAPKLLDQMKQTLEEAGIRSGQVIILEIQDADGNWPRGGEKAKEPEVCSSA